MITLITEPNLYYQYGAYLPPSLPSLGTACIAGSLKKNNISYNLIDFYPLYLKCSLKESYEYIEWLSIKFDDNYIRKLISKGCVKSTFQLFDLLYRWIFIDKQKTITSSMRLRIISETIFYIFKLYIKAIKYNVFINSPFINNLIRLLYKFNNQYIGVSLQDLSNPICAAVINYISNKGFTVIAGGQFSFLYKYDTSMLKKINDLKIKYFIFGYGEKPIIDLIDSFHNNKKNYKIKYVYNHNDLKYDKDIDINYSYCDIMPDFSKYNLDDYFTPIKILPIQTSRGCYWKKCVYCRREVYQERYNVFNIKKTIDTITYMKQCFDVKLFLICDEAHSPAVARLLANAILSNKRLGDIKIAAIARPDKEFNANLLNLMSRAGYKTLFFGIESGSNYILNKMRKGTNVETIKRVLKESSKAGISNLCFYMIGFPGETIKDINATIKLMKQTKQYVDYIRLNTFILQSRTYIFNNPSNFGIINIEKNPYQEDSYKFTADRTPDESTISQIRNDIKKLNYISGRLKLVDIPGDGDELLPLLFVQRFLDKYYGQVKNDNE